MITAISAAALALNQWTELSILLKATLLLMLGLAAARVAQGAKASIRHLVWVATFFALLTLPLMIAAVPRVAIEVPVERASGGVPAAAPAQAVARHSPEISPESSGWRMPSLLTSARVGWAAGVLFLLASLAFDLWKLRGVRRGGLPWLELREQTAAIAAECGVRRPVEILLHEGIAAPLTCGVWHPVVLLPSDARRWSEADLRRALVHEMEHVVRADWATQLVARLTCVLYWFHPLVWMAWQRLGLEAERACDDAVVHSAEPTAYADQLVTLAQRMSSGRAHAMLGMAKRGHLSTRVSALLDAGQPRGRVGFLAGVSAIVTAGLVTLAVAPMIAVAQEPRPLRVTAIDRALYEAAEEGDVASVEQLLRAGANVNSAIRGDGSPLIGAARKGRLPVVQLLLDRGADPDLPVSGDGNALIMAAGAGHAEVVTLLLNRGAVIDRVVPGDENALITASARGHLLVVQLLVSRGADVNSRVWAEQRLGSVTSGEWRTPLSMARKGGHAAVVDFLRAAGAKD